MSKNEKKSLSKAVGEWDNGFGDREKINYTSNEIRNAFLANRRYNQMMRSNQLQLILRGSASKTVQMPTRMMLISIAILTVI